MTLDELITGIVAIRGGSAGRSGGTYALDVPLSSGRKQVVVVSCEPSSAGTDLIRYYTEVGPVNSSDIMRQALESNMSVPFGAFAMHQGRLVMVDTQLLATADVPEVLNSILSLAVHADAAEMRIFGYRTDRH